MTPTTLMATAVLAEAWQSHLEEEAGGDHECVPEYCGEDVLRLALALPPDRRAALAAELLDVEGPEPPGGPEWRAFHLLRVELDAARVENARLRAALQEVAVDTPIGGWDGWGEVDRLRDITRAALKGT